MELQINLLSYLSCYYLFFRYSSSRETKIPKIKREASYLYIILKIKWVVKDK